MIGDKLETRHFGTYTEVRDDDITVQEFVGTVQVKEHNNIGAAFLYVRKAKNIYWRYDLPTFMKKYDGRKVAILGRPYVKQVGNKTYYKLVVIIAKPID